MLMAGEVLVEVLDEESLVLMAGEVLAEELVLVAGELLGKDLMLAAGRVLGEELVLMAGEVLEVLVVWESTAGVVLTGGCG